MPDLGKVGLNLGEVVMTDYLSSHKVTGGRETIEAVGA